jgi:hypothetical protein
MMAPPKNFFGTIEERLKDGYVIHKWCWFWLGATNRGYGKIRVDRKQREAHRVSYELAKGPIPDGMVLDHLCRVSNCINPDHLEPVTIAENIRRGRHAHREQTHCKRGHEFTADNPLVLISKRGKGRACRECARVRIRNWMIVNRKRRKD